MATFHNNWIIFTKKIIMIVSRELKYRLYISKWKKMQLIYIKKGPSIHLVLKLKKHIKYELLNLYKFRWKVDWRIKTNLKCDIYFVTPSQDNTVIAFYSNPLAYLNLCTIGWFWPTSYLRCPIFFFRSPRWHLTGWSLFILELWSWHNVQFSDCCIFILYK